MVRNVMAVAGGTVFAQALSLAVAPIITRLYGPEPFGVQGVFLSVLVLLTPVAAASYPLAIVVARGSREARGLVQLSLAFALCVSGAIFVLLLAFRQTVSSMLGLESLGLLVFILPFAMFFTAAQQVAEFWLSRNERFGLQARALVAQTTVTNIGRVACGLVFPVSASLVVLSSMAPALNVAFLASGFRVKRRLGRLAATLRRKKRTCRALAEFGDNSRRLAFEHRDFALYRAPTDFINTASQGLPVILLATFFGPITAGLYSLARSVLNVPMHLIGNAVRKVLYARLAAAHREGLPLRSLVVRTTLTLSAPAPFILAASFVFPPLFALLFGEEWRTAGMYAQWIALWSVCGLANIACVSVIPVIGLQKLHLILNVVMLAARIGALALGYLQFKSATQSIVLYSITSAILNVALIVMVLHFVHRSDRSQAAACQAACCA